MSLKYSFRGDTSAQVRASVIELMEKVSLDSVPQSEPVSVSAGAVEEVA